MISWLDDLPAALQTRERESLYRRRHVLTSAQSSNICIDDQRVVNFSSNDYLGLANHPAVVAAFTESAKTYGVGAGSAHLVVGHMQPHQQLERMLADVTGRERALVFSSGYMANLGVFSALLGRGDAVFEDRLNHASLLDGARLSGARLHRFRHGDTDHLESLLASKGSRRKLVAVDAVFSMDGDIAPLPKLASVAQRCGAVLMADDAHGFAVLGAGGGGSVEHFGLTQQQLPILMGTLGKACGVAGAFVAGSEALIETLIQHARTYVYTTALPPACASAACAAVQLIVSEPQRRRYVHELVAYFRRQLAGLVERHGDYLALPESVTPIQPIIVGDATTAMALSSALRQRGFLVTAIRPPTVPRGSARLRVSLSAAHTYSQVDGLLAALDDALCANATG